ncbi:FAD-dependent oxidoreductase [Nocardiopsis sp. NPDC101807]|uniref:FAD-dependent oxidoreductase n=1 Tax=Nocardiopsis sp. NPDC101807 TaxID=3364339 RepID=UPI0038016EEB
MTPAPTAHVDLLVIGGGPAGCAAALMADSLGLRTVLVEKEPVLCQKLRHIGDLTNVPGGHTTGRDLADAITSDIARTRHCDLLLEHQVAHLKGTDTHLEATLTTGESITALHTVVCTGVAPLSTGEADWITAPPDFVPRPLWEAKPTLAGQAPRYVLVLGADRPLGTHLRAHPHSRDRFLVVYPPADAYKTDEVRDDPRVHLLPTHHVALDEGDHLRVEVIDHHGRSTSWSADVAFTNIGGRPNPPATGVSTAPDGYCPSGEQHARVHIAGDLRSARFQRITTAMGSGSEAALVVYYAAQTTPEERFR